MKFCPNCGNELESNSKFCGTCGLKVEYKTPQPQPQPQPQPPYQEPTYTTIPSTKLDLSDDIMEQLDLGLIENFKRCFLKKYTTFDGRASRSEFWYFYAADMLLSNTLLLTFAFIGHIFHSYKMFETGFVLSIIYFFATFLPYLSVTVRRLHDINKSGWFVLVPLIPIVGIIWLIVMLATRGDENPNIYGPKTSYIKVTNEIAKQYKLLDTTQPVGIVVAITIGSLLMYVLADDLGMKYLFL